MHEQQLSQHISGGALMFLMDPLRHAALLIGCVLMGGLYIWAGVQHFFAITPLVRVLQSRNVPLPKIALLSTSIFQAIMGLCIVVDIYRGAAALTLVPFTIIASIVFFDFWNKVGPERIPGKRAWQSNCGVIGGLLVIAATQSL